MNLLAFSVEFSGLGSLSQRCTVPWRLSSKVAEDVGKAEEEVGDGSAGDELCVHEPDVLGTELQGGFARAPALGIEVDREWRLGAVARKYPRKVCESRGGS
jgi:hypothetical protein